MWWHFELVDIWTFTRPMWFDNGKLKVEIFTETREVVKLKIQEREREYCIYNTNGMLLTILTIPVTLHTQPGPHFTKSDEPTELWTMPMGNWHLDRMREFMGRSMSYQACKGGCPQTHKQIWRQAMALTRPVR